MDLSIIVVNWNTRDLLAQCLASIYAHPPNCEFETWVVDNASSDGSAQMVRERFSNVRLMENRENVGFACANNQAIQESAGRYVLLLNSDTQVCGNALTLLVEFMENHSRVGITGAKLLNSDGSFQSSYANFPTLISELMSAAGLSRWVYGKYFPSFPPEASREARGADWIGGACMIVRRAAIVQVGLLDEIYFMYSEEVDWCYRFWKAGWLVHYLPEAEIIHWKGQSSGSVIERREWLYKSKLWFFAKHHSKHIARLFQTGLRLIAAVKFVLWFCLGALSKSRQEIARREIQSNWLLVKLHEL